MKKKIRIYRYYLENEKIEMEELNCSFDENSSYYIENDFWESSIVHKNCLDNDKFHTEYYDSGIRDGYYYTEKKDDDKILDNYLKKYLEEIISIENIYNKSLEKCKDKISVVNRILASVEDKNKTHDKR